MLRARWLVGVAVLVLAAAGTANASIVSFVTDPGFQNVDTTGFSTNDSTVLLGKTNLSILNGDGEVIGQVMQGGEWVSEELSHRGTRGLGVKQYEPDEVDTLERLVIEFDIPQIINSIELRSLFVESTTERGTIEAWNGAISLGVTDVFATQSGGAGQLIVTPGAVVTRLAFGVRPEYTLSEYALAKLDVTAIPEPASIAVWSLLGGLGLIVAWRHRRRRAA